MVTLDRSAVIAVLQRIASSSFFKSSERRVHLLRYVVEAALAGETNVKEYTLGVEVLHKPESYDPRIDPIVRVEFGRMRQKLREYYAAEGSSDPLVIDFPQRSFVPVFSAREMPAAEAPAAESPAERRTRRRPPKAAVAAACAAVAVTVWCVSLFARHRAQTLSDDGYRQYWRAQFLLDQRTPQSVPQAVTLFERVTRDEPGSALAWAGLAYAYGVAAANDFEDPAPLGPKVRAAAERALKLAPDLAQAHSALGLEKCFLEWDWNGSDYEYRRAIALNPALADAHLGWAMSLLITHRFDQAIAEARRAVALDSGSFAAKRGLAMALNYARHWEEALEVANGLLRTNSQPWVHAFLRNLYIKLGRYPEARAEEARITAFAETTEPEDEIGLAVTNDAARTQREIALLLEEGKHRYLPPLRVSGLYSAVNDWAHHREWLEIAYRQRDPALVWISLEPSQRPGFSEIETKMGLPPSAP